MSAARALPVVPLLPGSRIVADLHLDVLDEPRPEGFLDWLGRIRGAPRLVILGDLFEFWVGPAQVGPAGGVLAALRELVEAGTAVDLVPGNRDFLLDRSFERASGARVRPRGLVGRLTAEAEPGGGAGGEGAATERRVLLIHGDELCTRDRGYQRLRRVLRSAPVRWLAPRLPEGVATRLARRLRGASRRAVAQKPRPETELPPAEAAARARAHGCRSLVCGHAHRFRDEPLEGGGRWLVVDAFGGRRDALRVSPGGELRVEGSRALA